MTTKFHPGSWKDAALTYATAAEKVAGIATDDVPPLGNLGSSACSNVTTLIDDAINAIFPASVEAISSHLQDIATQIVQDSMGLYDTGQLYRDIELDNTLASADIDAALGETAFN